MKLHHRKTTQVVALDSIIPRLLAELSTPASAASLCGRVGLTRQKVNYHLRALEEHKLVEIAEKLGLTCPPSASDRRETVAVDPPSSANQQ